MLNPQLDTSTPIGRLVFNMVGAIAQFEREIMLERQREGIAKAKREGKYKGRAPTAMAKSEEALTLLKGGWEPLRWRENEHRAGERLSHHRGSYGGISDAGYSARRFFRSTSASASLVIS